MMDIVDKATRKHFAIATGSAFLITLAAYQWLAALIVLWAALGMSGIVLFSSKSQVLVSIQWGIFLGLSTGLALLIWGPMEIYG